MSTKAFVPRILIATVAVTTAVLLIGCGQAVPDSPSPPSDAPESPASSDRPTTNAVIVLPTTNAVIIEHADLEIVTPWHLNEEHKNNPVRFERDRVGQTVEIQGRVVEIRASHVEIASGRGWDRARLEGVSLDTAADLNLEEHVSFACVIAGFAVQGPVLTDCR